MIAFKDICALIVDPTGHSRALLRGVLVSLGVRRISALKDTEQALQYMEEERFDVVFCDEKIDVIAFLKRLRRDVRTLDVTVPVILILAGANRQQIQTIRDAGVNDVIVKPVSPKTVEQKLQSLILTPKPFVAVESFVGPDRRRNRDDRRQFGERPPPAVDRRRQMPAGKLRSDQ